MRRASGRVRITGQLVEAETGRHIWAERYDRALDDVFVLQDEITLSVIGAIEPTLRQAEIERVRRKRPEHLDAYDLVLRAMPLALTAMPEGALQALPLLERALALEPDYALAHGYAGYCHEILFVRGAKHENNRQGAIHHAHMALTHGRDDAMAMTLAAFNIGIIEHDREVAREAFETSIALSPSLAFTYIWGGIVMGVAGEAERAIEWGERALRLSPFDPLSWGAWLALFHGHFLQGRYEDAANAARKAIQGNPGLSISHTFLAAALAKRGHIDEAKVVAARLLALEPGFSIRSFCSMIGPAPSHAASLSEALRIAGLPE
jgi:adenylate cyclase